MSKAAAMALLALAFISMLFAGRCHGALEVGFYGGKCKSNDVEAIVFKVVKSWFRKDPTIAAALLRMQFHDCFVHGCDASILLDGSNTEKNAIQLRGFEIIDAAKEAIEAVCPEVVSCADIIALATRDAVFMSGGGRYQVPTGRRDGLVSLAEDVDFPSPSGSVSAAIAAFAKKGLNATDLVFLLGGHTVGHTHCSFIQSRLYNFEGTTKPDPTMDLNLLKSLRKICPQNVAALSNIVSLDQNSSSVNIVDNSFYKQITANRGVLKIDQELAVDPLTKATVTAMAKSFDFSKKFGQALVKLGAVEVLTGKEGEIRRSCRAVNKK